MAASADNLRVFFDQQIGRSWRLGLTAGGTTQTPEALVPGKYLVRLLDHSNNSAHIQTGPAGTSITITVPGAVAGGGSDLVDTYRVDPAESESFVLHVKKGVNDRIAGRMAAGTGELWITPTGN